MRWSQEIGRRGTPLMPAGIEPGEPKSDLGEGDGISGRHMLSVQETVRLTPTVSCRTQTARSGIHSTFTLTHKYACVFTCHGWLHILTEMYTHSTSCVSLICTITHTDHSTQCTHIHMLQVCTHLITLYTSTFMNNDACDLHTPLISHIQIHILTHS